jgi:transcription antitermination factor NusG
MKAKGNKYCHVVAYVNSEFIDIVEKQLKKHREYKDIKAIIPTIKVLKKTFKGKHQFEDVPLLFQYGFFKIPRVLAIHADFLENLQKNISCIYGWVMDPHKLVRPHRVEKSKATGKLTDKHVPVATATSKEVSKLLRAAVDLGAHSAEDIKMLKPGDYITLKGYPYEGVEAEFMSLNPAKRLVKVRMILFSQLKEVEVSYDNVFFTLYTNKGYDESKLSETSLDDMTSRKTFDKLMKKTQKNEEA